jgi:hypothetical protein
MGSRDPQKQHYQNAEADRSGHNLDAICGQEDAYWAALVYSSFHGTKDFLKGVEAAQLQSAANVDRKAVAAMVKKKQQEAQLKGLALTFMRWCLLTSTKKPNGDATPTRK